MAHAYTRYLGDLSGGQVLGKITQKSLGLSSQEGLSFFSFPGVTSPNRFKQLYRSRMNGIELTEEERAAVLEEAVAAFELNIQVSGGGNRRADLPRAPDSTQKLAKKKRTESVNMFFFFLSFLSGF